MFPIKIKNENTIAYKYGLRYFNCGHCPECLSKKMNSWALRAMYEAKKYANNCMITLTYNDFLLDSRGYVCGETEPLKTGVDKRDCQLFIKRLRKYFNDRKIKYILTAEYGKRTHRPHYHVILFNVEFSDAVPYKRTKRGNMIYRSNILNNIWKHGICTIDNLQINSQSVKYCTKYAVKDSGNSDTFMLFSQGIGIDTMLEEFNGLFYVMDGLRYPIPKLVWQKYLTLKYADIADTFSYKYHNKRDLTFDDYIYYKDLNVMYRRIRNSDIEYKKYLDFWYNYSSLKTYVPVATRIDMLDTRRYSHYKYKATLFHSLRYYTSIFKAPDMPIVYSFFGTKFSFYIDDLIELQKILHSYSLEHSFWQIIKKESQLVAPSSCLLGATDTKQEHPDDTLLKTRVKIELDYRKLGDFTYKEANPFLFSFERLCREAGIKYLQWVFSYYRSLFHYPFKYPYRDNDYLQYMEATKHLYNDDTYNVVKSSLVSEVMYYLSLKIKKELVDKNVSTMIEYKQLKIKGV